MAPTQWPGKKRLPDKDVKYQIELTARRILEAEAALAAEQKEFPFSIRLPSMKLNIAHLEGMYEAYLLCYGLNYYNPLKKMREEAARVQVATEQAIRNQAAMKAQQDPEQQAIQDAERRAERMAPDEPYGPDGMGQID